jgi:hypothetical protein
MLNDLQNIVYQWLTSAFESSWHLPTDYILHDSGHFKPVLLNAYTFLDILICLFFFGGFKNEAVFAFVIRWKWKVKKFHYTPWRRLGGEEYSSYSFMTSALDGVSGQRHALAAL